MAVFARQGYGWLRSAQTANNVRIRTVDPLFIDACRGVSQPVQHLTHLPPFCLLQVSLPRQAGHIAFFCSFGKVTRLHWLTLIARQISPGFSLSQNVGINIAELFI
jgi:hypothetical protein